MSSHIFLCHYHDDLINSCDVFYQTAKQLVKRGFTVHLLFRNHPAVFFQSSAQKEEIVKSKFSSTELPYIHIFFPTSLLPKSYYTNAHFRIRKVFELFFHFVTKKYLAQYKEGIIWSFDHQNSDLFVDEELSTFQKVFDCVDFFSSPKKEFKQFIQRGLETQVRKADVVFVNSKVLYDYWKKVRKEIHLVAQGFDLESCEQGDELEAKKIHALRLPRPWVGMIGNFDYRIDFELLKKVIQENPTVTFFLSEQSGQNWVEDSVFSTDQKIAELKTFQNIYWIPQKPRTQISEWVASFDACLIPYNTEYDFVKNCYPMKLFEYFYYGKPVITTQITELKRFPDLIKISESHSVWSASIRNLKKSKWPQSKKKKEVQLAVSNSWDKKMDEMLKIIQHQSEA